MFQSPNRVKPLSNLSRRAFPHRPGPFQSPNRVKPLSNCSCPSSQLLSVLVSIAQSRQTSFQPQTGACNPGAFPGFQSPNRVKPLSNTVAAYQYAPACRCFNRPIASNLFPTSFEVLRARLFYRRFNRPIASNLFPTAPAMPQVIVAPGSFNRPIASNLFPTVCVPAHGAAQPAFQSPNRVKPLSNTIQVERKEICMQSFNRPIASNLFPTEAGHSEFHLARSFNRPIASNLFPTRTNVNVSKIAGIVSIAQSRQTSFQPGCRFPGGSQVRCFNRPIASNLFPTSLMRTKRRTNMTTFQSPNRVKPLSNLCICFLARSTFSMFQSPNRVKPLSNGSSSLQRLDRPWFQSPNRVKPLSNTYSNCLNSSLSVQSFNRPIASNLFPTGKRSPA